MRLNTLVQGFLRRFGYQLTDMPSLATFLQSRKIDLVLDVGGNVGQFAHGIRSRGYKGEIISFEPIPEAAGRLRDLANHNPPWTVHEVGLGETEAELDLNVSQSSVFSSFLPQTEFTQSFDKASAVAYVVKVKVQRLDHYLSQIAGRDVFLKIDAQGFERPVLAGIGECIHSIQGILLELPVKHLYQNTWRLEEAIAELRNLGFVISQVRPVNTLPDDPASVVELDTVFRRA